MWTNPNQNKETKTKTNKTRHWIKSREIQGLCLWTIRNCWNSASGHDLAVALMSPHPGAPAVVGVVDLSLGKVPVSATLWSLSTGKHKRPVTHRPLGNNWHLKSNASGVLSDPLILPSSPLPHLWIRATIYRASHSEAASEYALPSRRQSSLHDAHATW